MRAVLRVERHDVICNLKPLNLAYALGCICV